MSVVGCGKRNLQLGPAAVFRRSMNNTHGATKARNPHYPRKAHGQGCLNGFRKLSV